MKDCPACKMYGVIECVRLSEFQKLTKKQLIEVIEDIIETKKRRGKL